LTFRLTLAFEALLKDHIEIHIICGDIPHTTRWKRWRQDRLRVQLLPKFFLKEPTLLVEKPTTAPLTLLYSTVHGWGHIARKDVSE